MNIIHEKNIYEKIIDLKIVIKVLIQEKWLNYGQKK
jgi:hypothetical protein